MKIIEPRGEIVTSWGSSNEKEDWVKLPIGEGE
jgi:hypothetical protein